MNLGYWSLSRIKVNFYEFWSFRKSSDHGYHVIPSDGYTQSLEMKKGDVYLPHNSYANFIKDKQLIAENFLSVHCHNIELVDIS